MKTLGGSWVGLAELSALCDLNPELLQKSHEKWQVNSVSSQGLSAKQRRDYQLGGRDLRRLSGHH